MLTVFGIINRQAFRSKSLAVIGFQVSSDSTDATRVENDRYQVRISQRTLIQT